MPALVIFDCDGVLVDSERLSHEVLCEMLAEMGVQIGFDEAVQRFMGTSIPVCIERIGELLGRPAPADFLQRMGLRTREAFRRSLQPVPGVVQVLDGLRWGSCVASNGNREKVDFTLAHTGLLPRFAGRIFTADDVPHPKPAPDLFLHAARMLGADAAQVIVVEDSPTGVQAARAAGMRVIGYTGMTPPARLAAAGASELAATMQQVGELLARM